MGDAIVGTQIVPTQLNAENVPLIMPFHQKKNFFNKLHGMYKCANGVTAASLPNSLAEK